MIATALWLVGLFGAVTSVASLIVTATLRVGWVDRLHPRTRARIYVLGAALPLVVAAIVLAAILVPHTWFGLPDHCLSHGHHLHLCLSCGLAMPPTAFGLFAFFYGAWLVFRGTRVGDQFARARGALRRLEASRIPGSDLALLPGERPLAFVAGFFAPTVFVSEHVRDEAWSAVLAHERAHARHRDPLARLVARAALAAHPPGVAGWLERRLVTAQELAADEHAAEVVGDRLEVAHQVLAWARTQRPAGALGFDEGDLSTRIRVLMDAPRYLRGPSAHQLALAFAVGVLAIASMSPSIHHGAEEIVHLLEY